MQISRNFNVFVLCRPLTNFNGRTGFGKGFGSFLRSVSQKPIFAMFRPSNAAFCMVKVANPQYRHFGIWRQRSSSAEKVQLLRAWADCTQTSFKMIPRTSYTKVPHGFSIFGLKLSEYHFSQMLLFLAQNHVQLEESVFSEKSSFWGYSGARWTKRPSGWKGLW